MTTTLYYVFVNGQFYCMHSFHALNFVFFSYYRCLQHKNPTDKVEKSRFRVLKSTQKLDSVIPRPYFSNSHLCNELSNEIVSVCRLTLIVRLSTRRKANVDNHIVQQPAEKV